MEGLEPTTYGLGNRRSIQLSYIPKNANALAKSEWRDLNPRPPLPQSGALPSCATSGFFHVGKLG